MRVSGTACVIAGALVHGESANASVSRMHLLGDGVIVHGGANMGCDGFGFAPGAAGMSEIPQVGRAILLAEVEIGGNTVFGRGSCPGDTRL